MPKTEIKLKPKLQVIKEDEIPHILAPGELGAVLELIVSDKDGKVTEHRVQKSESFVRQFLTMLFVEFNKVVDVSGLRIVAGNYYVRFVNFHTENLRCDGGVGVTGRGIAVGTGTTAPDIDDNFLKTPIAHGTGGGRLQYSAVTFGAPASDATISQFTITRNFANGSGAGITVNEIGLYGGAFAGGATHDCLFIRDVIAGGILVPNGQTLTINYRIQAAV